MKVIAPSLSMSKDAKLTVCPTEFKTMSFENNTFIVGLSATISQWIFSPRLLLAIWLTLSMR